MEHYEMLMSKTTRELLDLMESNEMVFPIKVSPKDKEEILRSYRDDNDRTILNIPASVSLLSGHRKCYTQSRMSTSRKS